MPRSIASWVSTFMSPGPEPSLTISRSWATTSKRSLGVIRATTRWIEFVPMSIAASAASGGGPAPVGGRAARHGADATLRPVVTAFVLISAEPSRIATLAQQLSDLKGIGEVYSVAGDEDLVAIVRVQHHDELAEVVTQRISALEGIVATRTLIAFQAYSKHDLEAMWSIGWE